MDEIVEGDGEEEGQGEVELAEDGAEDGELSEDGRRDDGVAEDVDVERSCGFNRSAFRYAITNLHRQRIHRSSPISRNIVSLKIGWETAKLVAYHRSSPRSSVRLVRPRGAT